MPRAADAAHRALALDPTLAEAHASLGVVHLIHDWDWDGAARALRTAIALKPDYATAHQWYANYLLATGARDEAVQALGRARALDPLSLAANAVLGPLLVLAGRYEAGIEQLQQMLALEPAWRDCDIVWVTLGAPDSEHLLRERRVVWAHGPTNRSLRKLVRNVWLAARTLHRVDPDAVLSTGAALAVPFAWVARLHGARVVFVEAATRTRSVSLACRLVAPVADRVYVQWPELAQSVRRGRYAGNTFLPDA